jgi:hypothetical protein
MGDKMKLNLFELAEVELKRENKEPTKKLILDRAIVIRRWLDKHRQATAIKIMAGAEIYHYGNQIKTYYRA